MDLQKLVSLPLRQLDRMNQYIDSCTCARGAREIVAIKQELEKKDTVIERLEEEIRRKDSEKDNLMAMQRDLQGQISQIRAALEAQAAESEERLRAATFLQSRVRGNKDRKSVRRRSAGGTGSVALTGEGYQSAQDLGLDILQQQKLTKVQARVRGNSLRSQGPLRDVAARKGYRTLNEELEGPIDLNTKSGAERAAATATSSFAGANVSPYKPQYTPPTASGAQGFGGGGGAGAPGQSMAGTSVYDDESIDSDYDYDDSAFAGLGRELLAGKLKLAKVYGQDEVRGGEWRPRGSADAHTRQGSTRHGHGANALHTAPRSHAPRAAPA